MSEQKRETVFLKLHKAWAKKDLPNKKTGEKFNIVTLPPKTMLGLDDVGGFTFSPLFINRDKFDASLVVIPLQQDREVWLRKPVGERGADGTFVPKLDKDKKPVFETVKVMPQALKQAIDQSFRNFKQERAAKRAEKQESVADKTDRAQAAAQAKGKDVSEKAKTQEKAKPPRDR